MVERLDALSVRESNGKSYFTRIGVAFPAKGGPGYTVLLDAMPAPTDGQFKIMLREPLPPRDGQSYNGNPQTNASGSASQNRAPAADLDDDIPGF